MRHLLQIPLLLIALLTPSAIRAQSGGITFSDATASAGIAWTQGDPGNMMGAGGAFLDYDQDGHMDIFLIGGDHPPALYRNLGNGTYANTTVSAGLNILPVGLEWFMGCAVADYDNDGYPDIYVYVWGYNRLFRNNGNGTFTDATTPVTAGASWTTAAAWVDYDGDGWLDLYEGNYIHTFNYPNHTAYPNRLLRNNGDGTFTDVTAITGLAGAGTTLAVMWSDYDGDGDPDLWVCNDFGAFIEPNRLYRNDGPAPGPPGAWTFTEVSATLGADAQIYCMGITAGDIDRDGRLDYYFSNLGRNVLLRNDGPAGFTDVTTPTGTENTHDLTTPAPHLFATSWGVGFHDFDCDGWIDLYVSNGHIPADPVIANGNATPNVLFRHQGAAITFVDVAASAGVAHTGVGRGCAFADMNNNGAMDILQVNVNGPPVLLRNETQLTGSFARFLPRGRISNRDGIGTRVDLHLPGGIWLVREANGNYSYESSSENAVHFGLGGASLIERFQARWRSGITQEYHYLPSNVAIPLVEPLATVHGTSSGPAAVSGGTTAVVNLVVQNHDSAPLSAFHVVQLAVGGSVFWTGPTAPLNLPANGLGGAVFSVYVPPGATGGATIPVEVLWTVFDAGLGIDQWRHEVLVGP